MEQEATTLRLLQHYGADATMDDRVAFLVDRLLEIEQVRDWKNAVEQEIRKPEYSLASISSSSSTQVDTKTTPSTSTSLPLYRVLEKMGMVAALKRVVVDVHCEYSRAVQVATQQHAKQEEATLMPDLLTRAATGSGGNTLDVVAKARESWEAITRDELLRFASEHNRPLISSRQQTPAAADAGATVESETTTAPPTTTTTAPLPASNPEPVRSYKPPPSTRFLYDGHDLLRTLQAIKPLNRSTTVSPGSLHAWGSIQLQLYAPCMVELRRLFAELAPGHGQIGVDELFAVERQAFLTEKQRVGHLVSSHRHHQSVAMARQYAKTGCPTSLRSQIWRQALGVSPVSAETRQFFQQLQDQVTTWTYVTDDMYLLDLQRAIDSSDYFVFQDHLDSVVLAFTRDATVLDRAPQVNGAVQLSPQDRQRITTTTTTSSKDSADSPCVAPLNDFVPPNGVLPFSGLVLYVAPLTYLYTDAVELYVVFREMYVRYWSRLNALSTVLPLCSLFESLVHRSSPGAVLHLLSVDIQPLDVVFPWIQSAFSGVLEIHQLLLLWDRVVGYDSLELLAVFAAALFHFRAASLQSVACMDDVRVLYAELLDIHAIPLLQEYLFLLA